MRWRWVWLCSIALALFFSAPPANAEQGVDYVVAPGDALENIARRFGTNVDALIAINGLQNPNRIRVGQQLLIPIVVPGNLPVVTTTQVANSSYVVAPGDTIDRIAARLGLTVYELIAANGLPNPNLLQIGQRLVIPSSQSDTRPAETGITASVPLFDPNRIVVPYLTQFDGTRYADSNCGPATLGMLMAAFDEWWSPNGIRRDVNTYTGDWSEGGGSSWESLVYAARKRGFLAVSLTEGKKYRRWTFDDLMAEVRAGRAPMLLVRYANLPGHAGASWWGDHYIVLLGTTPDGKVLYHDSAFYGSDGAYRQMSKEQLMRAWSTNIAGIQYSAMVLKWALPVE